MQFHTLAIVVVWDFVLVEPCSGASVYGWDVVRKRITGERKHALCCLRNHIFLFKHAASLLADAKNRCI